MWNNKGLVLTVQKGISKVKVFKKKYVKLQCQGHRVKIHGDIYMKYQNTSSHCSKGISKVKVFKKMGQTPMSRSQGKKNNGTHGKVLLHGIFI